MKERKSSILKTFKLIGIFVGAIMALLIILPLLFEDTITQKVKVLANESLEGALDFNNSNLSFFSHFPSLTLELENLKLNGSAPFKNETLVAAKEIGFGINLASLIFGNNTEIDRIYLNEADINIQVNKKGEANYNVYISKDSTASKQDGSASLQLENIQITNSHLLYNDASVKLLIDAVNFNYKGKGNLLESDFKLNTSANINNLSLSYDSVEYLKNKKVKANLITKINTNSLAFIFEKNDLIINKLPVEFSGFFNFLSNGYKMDFRLKTENSNLEDLFSALPPQYLTWMKQTKLSGKTDANLSLKGSYIASKNLNPEINFKIKVRDGLVQNNKSPYPVENIYLNLETKLPNLDINKLQVKLDSLYFKVNKNTLSAILKLDGFGENMQIDAETKGKMDFETLSKAIQIPNFTIKGILDTDIVSKGTYSKNGKKIPVTKGFFNLTNGYLQTAYYPKPIENININSQLNCTTGNFSDASFVLKPSTFTFEEEPFNLAASFINFDDVKYDIKANGKLNISNIYKVFSQKGLDVNGFVRADVNLKGKQSDATNGNYQKLDNSGTLEIVNIETSSDYLAKPFLIKNGLFTFQQDKMHFTNFKGVYGASDITMNGYLENVINFVMSDNEIIKGDFALNSDKILINEFIKTSDPVSNKETTTQTTNPTKTSATETIGVIEIPTFLDVNIKANVLKTLFDDIEIKNLQGKLSIKNGGLKLSNASLGIIGAVAKMDASYKNEGTEKAYFDYSIKAEDFDIKRAYNEINMFKEIVSAAKYAEGIISIDYKLKGVLNNEMMPVFPSLVGAGTLSVKQVKMKGFKLLSQVAKKTESDAINDPDISKVDIKSTIKNNILTIERFKFKTAGFRLRFEGQSSLDGKLNLKMRVGLPPLGIIGIPIKVTGTQENPNIGIGKKSDDLEETDYVDGESPLVNPTNETESSSTKAQIDNSSKPNTISTKISKDSLPQNTVKKDSINK